MDPDIIFIFLYLNADLNPALYFKADPGPGIQKLMEKYGKNLLLMKKMNGMKSRENS